MNSKTEVLHKTTGHSCLVFGFLESVDTDFQREDVGILRDGEVSDVGEGVIDGNYFLDADTDAKVYLEGGLIFAIEIGFLLEVADAGADGDDFLVGELHSEVWIDAEHIRADEGVTFTIEGEVEIQSKGGIEALAEFHILGSADQQFGESEFQGVGWDFISGSFKHVNHLVAEVIAPRIESGGGVA